MFGREAAEEIIPLVQSRAGARGELDDFRGREIRRMLSSATSILKPSASATSILVSSTTGARTEDRRIFQRLVFALGGGEQHDAHLLAEVERRGADEIADVFNEENFRPR